MSIDRRRQIKVHTGSSFLFVWTEANWNGIKEIEYWIFHKGKTMTGLLTKYAISAFTFHWFYWSTATTKVISFPLFIKISISPSKLSSVTFQWKISFKCFTKFQAVAHFHFLPPDDVLFSPLARCLFPCESKSSEFKTSPGLLLHESNLN